MATYAEIRTYVKEKYGFTPQTCWIAHAKEICGLPVKDAPNRQSPDRRVKPCPPNKLEAIVDAFQALGMTK